MITRPPACSRLPPASTNSAPRKGLRTNRLGFKGVRALKKEGRVIHKVSGLWKVCEKHFFIQAINLLLHDLFLNDPTALFLGLNCSGTFYIFNAFSPHTHFRPQTFSRIEGAG
ncbi:hypothetical protein, partial [Nitrospina watsonii]|uniref:hypothetical protein n=1 Tax=Nitrospina watsonii TaxID=1323948 RepID=UPI002491445F